MAVQLETTTQRFRGLSTDVKPALYSKEVGEKLSPPPIGSVFTETDTGRRFVWTGSWPWVRQEQTIETLLSDLIDVNLQILETLSATQRGHEEYLWENEVLPE